jgi:putative DNA primase/helicase
MVFDGQCWRRDDTMLVTDMVRQLCRETANTAARPQCESARTINAVEKLARSDRLLAASTEQWDSAPMLLNAQGTAIDLASGDSNNVDAADYCSKTAACPAAPPGTPHPTWTAFLDRVVPDCEAQTFLQRYCGYALTARMDEQKLLFLYGSGANGKSVFLSTLQNVFGDYCKTASMETFLAAHTSGHPTDLARLQGARLVIAQEAPHGRRWDEVRIKALTSGDRISARFMHQDLFEYAPVCKLLFAGNHKPQLSSVGEAMKRRLLLVPFAVQIPPAERDPDLPRKLAVEHSAILRWCIDGCLRWQSMGLAPPQQVIAGQSARSRRRPLPCGYRLYSAHGGCGARHAIPNPGRLAHWVMLSLTVVTNAGAKEEPVTAASWG